jgi:CRP-like cAMP-binding protein
LLNDYRQVANPIQITHESMAILLGARRASVSQAIAELQRAGLIECRRGEISILDRAGLEAASCEDYRLSKHGYDHIYR